MHLSQKGGEWPAIDDKKKSRIEKMFKVGSRRTLREIGAAIDVNFTNFWVF